ncbi:MAG: class I SAM-dependent methyltransferase [Saprospiraceae bacterium]|nr:class I SAM-dependent methyltransferase [Saprospiraceae bacterium]
MTNYHPESYWSEVARRIKQRNGANVIAGDDEPFYRYKRNQFLNLLHGVDFKGKSVLEIGCGPGGNLVEVFDHQPARLVGVDISQEMISIAKGNVDPSVEIIKVNGTSLPFKDGEFDIVFTATVLQHNTDEAMLKQLMDELCRVSGDRVYLFERIEKDIIGDELCYGRPVSYYEAICAKNGFRLESKSFINIRVSYYVSGALRKLLNPKTRKEGEPLTGISYFLQQATLPVTRMLDKVFTSSKDVARLAFRRN